MSIFISMLKSTDWIVISFQIPTPFYGYSESRNWKIMSENHILIIESVRKKIVKTPTQPQLNST